MFHEYIHNIICIPSKKKLHHILMIHNNTSSEVYDHIGFKHNKCSQQAFPLS